MKTLFFCNLRPDKDGAFERVLAQVGLTHRQHGDQLVLVLAGEPSASVAVQFHEAGIKWCVIPEWTESNVGGAPVMNGTKVGTFSDKPTPGPSKEGIEEVEKYDAHLEPTPNLAKEGINHKKFKPNEIPSLEGHAKRGWVSTRGGPTHIENKVRPWGFVFPALKLLRQERPDVAVVHFGNELPSLALSLLAPLIGVRGVKWVWQQDQQMALPGRLTRLVSRIRLLALRFNRFVAVYEGGRAAMTARGIPDSQIEVVHNGVMDPEPEKNLAAVRQWLGEGGGSFNIDVQDRDGKSELSCESCLSILNPAAEQSLNLMSVGSMIPRKRQGVLVEVFAELVQELKSPALRLILIGDGPERAALEQQVQALGLQNQVVFLGKRNDVSRLLCGADIFIHAAAAEGCAYALSEAMAAGVPLVVTDAGAAREQVENGVNGYVVPVTDRAMFRERLKELIQNETLRQRMGEASRARWAKGFRVEDQAQAYWEIYKSRSQ